MHHLNWIGRAYYWVCIGLAALLTLASIFRAVQDSHLHYLAGPIWIAAILYLLGPLVRNWTAARVS